MDSFGRECYAAPVSLDSTVYLVDLRHPHGNYEQALLINDDYTEALKNLGEALLQQGRREEAIAYLEKARNLFEEQNIQDEAYRVEQLLQQAR